ncbi:MAG: DUF4391 domain-containing protein [Terracidiphilus sp.]|jgi:hypothetical protein
MSFAPVIDSLGIPPSALVEQRVPKKLLLEHGAPTAADKRQIQDGIDEIVWVAALKPTNIGVPAFQDAVREYLEVAVLTVELRPAAKPARLIELIHRAIPYPLILATGQGRAVSLSLAHKRWSQGEAGKVVIEEVRQAALNPEAPSTQESEFLASLSVSRLPTRDLFAFYDGILVRLAALEAAHILGRFLVPADAGAAVTLAEALEARARIERQLVVLRAQARRETQVNRRVQINLEMSKLERNLSETLLKVGGSPE